MATNHASAALKNIVSSSDNQMGADSERTDFLNRMLRDLRAPLNSINGAIFYLQQFESTASDNQKEFYNIISAEANRLTGAVEKLIEFLRAEDEARAVDRAIHTFLEFVAELLGLGVCSVMLNDELTDELVMAGAVGLDNEMVMNTRIKVGERIAGRVALEGKPLLIKDIETEPAIGRKSIPRYNTKSLLSLPLRFRDKVIGVMNLNNKKTAEPFNDQDLRLASVVCERVSYVIGKLHSGERTPEERSRFLSSLEHLVATLKRYHKKDHRFQELMGKVIDRFELTEEEKEMAVYVSMIYDLGLVSGGDAILKKEKLHPAEARSVKAHPHTTVDLISSFEFSEDVKEAILHHHERYDGTGYPDGLKYDQIPPVSRALSVVDAFCSMTGERPYKKTLPREGALQEITLRSGTAYDPKAVKALVSCLA